MLGLRNDKNVLAKTTIYVSSVQKLLWYFFVKCIVLAQTGTLHFDSYQILLVIKFRKMKLSVKNVDQDF